MAENRAFRDFGPGLRPGLLRIPPIPGAGGAAGY
jgi:hypothetical protein